MWEEPDTIPEWFNEKASRKNFAAKVFLITAVMLLIAAVIVSLPMSSDAIQEAFVFNITTISIVALVGGGVSMISLVCCGSCRHKFPINLILLLILCVSYGLIAAVASVRYSTYVVLISFGTTVVIVLLVAILAKWGPFDITGCGLLMCGLSIGLTLVLLVSIIVGLFFHIPLVHLIIACVVVLVYIIFLLYDMQLIVGGRNHEMGETEYILGAVMLFTDIIMIFLYLMQIISAIFYQSD